MRDKIQAPVLRDRFDELNETVQREPDNAWAWLNLARAFIETQNLAQARHLLGRARACAPAEDAVLWVEIGYAFEDAQDEANALAAFGCAARVDPTRVGASLGRLLLEMGQPAAAEEALRRALSHSPREPAVHYQLGRSLVALRRFEDAARHVEEVLAADPNRPEYLELAATVWKRLRYWAQAEAAYRALRTLRPTDPRVLVGLAESLAAQGDRDTARRMVLELKISEALSPQEIRQFGRIALQAGATANAVEWLRRVVAATPSLPAVWLDLGRALEADKKYDRAIDAYRTALSLAPRMSRTHFYLGRALARVGLVRESARFLIQAAARAPDNKKIQQLLSAVLRQVHTAPEPREDTAPKASLAAGSSQVGSNGPATDDDGRAVASDRSEDDAEGWAFSGKLELFSLPEFLEFLTVQRATGELKISSGAGEARVLLLNGRIVEAVAPGSRSPRQFLQERFPSLDLAEVIAQRNLELVEHILRQNTVGHQEIGRALEDHIIETLGPVAEWRDGRASFARRSFDTSLTSDLFADARFVLLEIARRDDTARADRSIDLEFAVDDSPPPAH